jgi:hypothetical protein
LHGSREFLHSPNESPWPQGDLHGFRVSLHYIGTGMLILSMLN